MIGHMQTTQTKPVHEGYEQSLLGPFEAFFYEITFEGENYHTTTNASINISFNFFLRHLDQDVI